MYCFYQLFLKPYPRQGSLTSKIKHFKRDSLPLSIPRQFTPVGTAVVIYRSGNFSTTCTKFSTGTQVLLKFTLCFYMFSFA